MCYSHICVLRTRTWELILIDLTQWMISNINCLVFLLEGCSLAGRMERNWQIGPAPLISRMTEQWRVAVTQAPGTNTRGNDCRHFSLLVWTTNVNTGCVKNEIAVCFGCLALLPTVQKMSGMPEHCAVFPLCKPWGYFGICHKNPWSLQDGNFYVLASPLSLPMLCVKVWQYGRMWLQQRMSQHDSIGAHRAHRGMWSLE